jgi:hypothetical protein
MPDDRPNPIPAPDRKTAPGDPGRPAGVLMVAHVLPFGETIEIDGSTVDDPETGEPRPAAVLRLPADRLRRVAGALDLWHCVRTLVTDRGLGLIEAELSAALVAAADTLAEPDRTAREPAPAAVNEPSGSPEQAAARAEQVGHAYTAALTWLRAVTWNHPAPRTVFTDLKAAAARLESGEDIGDPGPVLVLFAAAALTGTDTPPQLPRQAAAAQPRMEEQPHQS